MSKEHLPTGSRIVDAAEALQLVSSVFMLEGVSDKLGPIRVPRGLDVLENEATGLLVAHTILAQLVQRARENCDFGAQSKHSKKKAKKRAKAKAAAQAAAPLVNKAEEDSSAPVGERVESDGNHDVVEYPSGGKE